MHILIPVDGSAHALDAVRHLIAHADWFRTAPVVELLSVHPILPQLPDIEIGIEQVNRYYRAEGERAQAWAKEMLQAAGIAYSTATLAGDVAERIVSHGKQTHCDLILMSTRGAGAAGRRGVGSTAAKVLYLSALPVLVVNSTNPT